MATKFTTTSDLPSPVDYPEADVVIFDGQCSFCRSSVERIRQCDGKHRVAFISLHDPLVSERYAELTHDQLMDQMYLVDRDGKLHGGVRALRYLSRRLPKLWMAAPLLHVPGSLPVWNWLYRFIARHRYLIMGKTAECENGTCKI